jgi:hypothetical protein
VSSNFLQQMAEFNQRIGKPMPDPTRIEGFGSPSDPPPPPLPDVKIPSAREMYGEPVEHEMSPLVRVAHAPQAAPPPRLTEAQMKEIMEAQPQAEPVGMPELIVLDTSASLAGHAVLLSITEEAAVKRVIIGAIERSMKDERTKLTNLLPRRGRPVKAKDGLQASKDAPGTPRKAKGGKGGV